MVEQTIETPGIWDTIVLNQDVTVMNVLKIDTA